MGIKNIMQAKKILVVVSGEDKAAITGLTTGKFCCILWYKKAGVLLKECLLFYICLTDLTPYF